MNSKAYTLIELLVTITILTLLASVMLPVIAKAKESARKSACVSNLRQIGQALQMYVQDNNERYPVNVSDLIDQKCDSSIWRSQGIDIGTYPSFSMILKPYVEKNPLIFICPDLRDVNDDDNGVVCMVKVNEFRSFGLGYALNTSAFINLGSNTQISSNTTILHCMGQFHGSDDITNRQCNVLFADGRVKFMKRANLVVIEQTGM